MTRLGVAAGVAVGVLAGRAVGQSALVQSPNLQGVWAPPAGHAVFVFSHRFEVLPGGDELFVVPTLGLGVGLGRGLATGLTFTSNAEAVPRNLAGNETELWVAGARVLGRWAIGPRLAYNRAARSWDGAMGLRFDAGAAQLFGEARAFQRLFGGGPGAAMAAGVGLRLTPYLALVGDVGRAVLGDSLPRAAWSAGLALALPGTPHTLALYATNSGATTLQGASRAKAIGPEPVRYGFLFTTPLGSREQWRCLLRPGPTPPQDTGAAVRVALRQVAFVPARVRVQVGQTVEWVNEDPTVHTVTADDRTWSSPLLREGERFRHRFDRPGRFRVHCEPHPQMRMIIEVQPTPIGVDAVAVRRGDRT